jgi:hypothetical protein
MGDGPALEADAEFNEYARKALEEAPRLHHPYHWQAFNSLTSERQYGMGPGPIPDSVIERYAIHDGLSRIEREVLMYVIRVVDNRYLHLVAEQSKKASS